MEIYHEEEPITTIINGKKFTTYKDAYTEDLGEFKCPCCSKEMQYHEGTHILEQGCFTKSFEVSCDICSLTFYGYEGVYDNGFKDKNDFLLFIKQRLSIKKSV